MSAFTTITLAPTGSTGNPTLPAGAGAPVDASQLSVAFLFTVEAAGATPTVTYQFQGSSDGVNWYPVQYVTDSSDTAATTARTRTSVGQDIAWLSLSGVRQYSNYRVVVSANTNITFRAALALA